MEEKTQILHLNAWQQFLYIKGCLTSASEQCEIWRFFIEQMYVRHTVEQRDKLWALVYRDIYSTIVECAGEINFKPLYWDDMLRFLAMYNYRNLTRLIVKHSKYGHIAVRAYRYKGCYWQVGSTTKMIPPEWIKTEYAFDKERQHINIYLGLLPDSAYNDTSIY